MLRIAPLALSCVRSPAFFALFNGLYTPLGAKRSHPSLQRAIMGIRPAAPPEARQVRGEARERPAKSYIGKERGYFVEKHYNHAKRKKRV